MQKQSSVSVIVPVYNAEKTIERCLDSILAQEYRNIQIIVVNDGSTDNTKRILMCNYVKNNNIKYIEKENGGVSSARNTGILNASGEYILFVDSDDYLLPNMCSELIQVMNSGADLAVCGFYIESGYGEKKSIVPNKSYINQILTVNQCFEMAFFGYLLNVPWNKMFRKTRIKYLFNQKKKYGEDIEFVLEYAKDNCKIAFSNKELYVNNIENISSLSKNYRNIFGELVWNHIYIYKYLEVNKITLSKYNFTDYCVSQIWTNVGQAMREKKFKFKEILNMINIDTQYYKMLEKSKPKKIVNKLTRSILLSENRLLLHINIKIIYWFKIMKDFMRNIPFALGGRNEFN